jgi:hypothetical protein
MRIGDFIIRRQPRTDGAMRVERFSQRERGAGSRALIESR